MTSQAEVINDLNYIPVFDYGFVGLDEHMGSDATIDKVARLSYGKGTRSTSEIRTLIRYLRRHKHTSPFEQCEVRFHIKCPIFVIRQLVRHRTHALNEYSSRYSVMPDEFYVPELAHINPQSKTNKQGRDETAEFVQDAKAAQYVITSAYEHASDHYKTLLADYASMQDQERAKELQDPDLSNFSQDFKGIARETARIVLPTGVYTEFYWKQNLHNLFHLLGLRLDSHAQYEIRVFAQAMYDLVKPLYPIACEAFEDYHNQSVTLSRMEVELIRSILNNTGALEKYKEITGHDDDKLVETFGLTKREFQEFNKSFISD